MPADVLEAQSSLLVIVARFIGVCELAGALGLILPGILRIGPILTSLAAAGLVVLMIRATSLTPILVSPDPMMMLLPAKVGVVAGFVGYARLRLAPLRARQ
jgi:DoxX-like protein